MKIEDVNKAVELKEEIGDLTSEINQLQKHKALEENLHVYGDAIEGNFIVPNEAKDDVLEVVIKAKSKRLKELQEQLADL